MTLCKNNQFSVVLASIEGSVLPSPLVGVFRATTIVGVGVLLRQIGSESTEINLVGT